MHVVYTPYRSNETQMIVPEQNLVNKRKYEEKIGVDYCGCLALYFICIVPNDVVQQFYIERNEFGNGNDEKAKET